LIATAFNVPRDEILRVAVTAFVAVSMIVPSRPLCEYTNVPAGSTANPKRLEFDTAATAAFVGASIAVVVPLEQAT
jgi:hypothetical protein